VSRLDRLSSEGNCATPSCESVCGVIGKAAGLLAMRVGFFASITRDYFWAMIGSLLHRVATAIVASSQS
jgi:hypothetical protein